MYCFAKSLTFCTDFGAIAAADENYIRTYSSTSRSCCDLGKAMLGWAEINEGDLAILLVAFLVV